MSDQPAARPECEHYWASHCYSGLSVRLCQLCHEPDWEDFRGQLAEAERKGELAEWIDQSEASGTPMWQNRRDPSVFSIDGGKTHYSVA